MVLVRQLFRSHVNSGHPQSPNSNSSQFLSSTSFFNSWSDLLNKRLFFPQKKLRVLRMKQIFLIREIPAHLLNSFFSHFVAFYEVKKSLPSKGAPPTCVDLSRVPPWLSYHAIPYHTIPPMQYTYIIPNRVISHHSEYHATDRKC